MSFLAPLFLIGALAVAAPIIFHLIRRTTRDKIPFSSLMFLMPTPPRVTRRSRLENIFLLILRCLVLCLLALGFSRPFLQKPMAAGTQSGTGTRLVLLVDTSASMKRDALWSDARAKAEAVLKATSPADAVAVFAFDRTARSLVSFDQWSGMAVADRVSLTVKRLTDLSPGWASTHLGHALITAVEAIEDTSGREQVKNWTGPKKIVVLTDLQEGSRLEGLQGYEWPKGIELTVEPLKPKRPTNAGLQLVTDHDESTKPAADAAPRVRVSNSGDTKREQFQVGWARVGDKNFTGAPIEVYVPPGQSRIVEAPKPPPGLAAERLALTGDDEGFDNTVHLAPPKPQQIKILFLGNDSEKDSAQSLYYVKRAFQETRREIAEVIARPDNVPLTQADFDGAQLLIATDTLPEDRLKTARAFLDAGRTVLFAMKSAAAAPTVARLAGLDSLAAEEAPGGGYAMFSQINFEHPVFAPFADPRYSDFTKIHFWKHRRLDVSKIKDARLLARFDKGDPAFLQLPAGKGTLLVLACGWHPGDSQLALSSKFVPLLYSILEMSGGFRPQLAQYAVGDEVSVSYATNAPSVTVARPDGKTAPVARGEGKFSQTDLPGIYTVTSLVATQRFAVNLDPAESKTAPLPLEELERLGLPLKLPAREFTKVAKEKEEHLKAAELESRQKLWRWLIVCALVVLLLETFVAGRLTRKAAAPA